ncbi:MAG: 3'-5' exonuclease [Bdellovibrionota bacterium]
MNLEQSWSDHTLVAFDLETSGAFPRGHDIVEFGAVKWKDGKEVDQLQLLIKPRRPMGVNVIQIHGISNEMVEGAPSFKEVSQQIRNFFDGTVGLAHHAPFDMGFLADEFERAGLTLPDTTVLCTSLLSRKLINDVENHKLQTLVKALGLPGGQAHRALDDARACLHLGLKCFEKAVPKTSLKDLQEIMEKKIHWPYYSLNSLEHSFMPQLNEAMALQKPVKVKLSKGEQKGQWQTAFINGIVRNPDGDYIAAYFLEQKKPKRIYFDAIEQIQGPAGVEFVGAGS